MWTELNGYGQKRHSKGTPGDAKCVTKIFWEGGKIWKLGDKI